MKKLILLLLFATQIALAQSPLLTETINSIELKEDTIKSVFDWMAENIAYDVKKMNEIKKKEGSDSNQSAEFRTEAAYQEDLLQIVMKKKKGVCQDYALLFDAIVRELGYESKIITGYIKDGKGKVQRAIGHAWNAVKVNGTWRFYDPTWGAGFVNEDDKFVKQYQQQWYDVTPGEMIKTHMPFDPIWQLWNSPMRYSDFEDNTTTVASTEPYHYETLISQYMKKSEKEQMKEELSRSKEMGDGIPLINKWRKDLTKRIGLYEIHTQPDLLEQAGEKAMHAVNLYNDYIAAKNKNFKGKKWTADYCNQTLESAKEQMTSALDTYKSIQVEDPKVTKQLSRGIKDAEKFIKQVDVELKFVEKMNSINK
jgi:hypothetical protein